MSTAYKDIRDSLDALARLSDTRSKGPDSFIPAAERFTDDDAPRLAALLDELAALRERTGGSDQSPDYVGTHRFAVEGTSDKNAEEALAHALSNAAHFFSEHHDVILTLAQLGRRPEGGFRAIVDVHITMFKPGHTTQTPEAEARVKKGGQFRTGRKAERERVAHMVFDHFMHVKSGAPGNMPSSFLVNITDAALLNKLIEKQFFKSSHPAMKLDAGGLSIDEPFTLLVRAKAPEKPEPK